MQPESRLIPPLLDLWCGFKSEVEQRIRPITAACVELLRPLYSTVGGLIKGNEEVLYHQAVASSPTAAAGSCVVQQQRPLWTRATPRALVGTEVLLWRHLRRTDSVQTIILMSAFVTSCAGAALFLFAQLICSFLSRLAALFSSTCSHVSSLGSSLPADVLCEMFDDAPRQLHHQRTSCKQRSNKSPVLIRPGFILFPYRLLLTTTCRPHFPQHFLVLFICNWGTSCALEMHSASQLQLVSGVAVALWPKTCFLSRVIVLCSVSYCRMLSMSDSHPTRVSRSQMFKRGLSDTDTCSQCTLGSTVKWLPHHSGLKTSWPPPLSLLASISQLNTEPHSFVCHREISSSPVENYQSLDQPQEPAQRLLSSI